MTYTEQELHQQTSKILKKYLFLKILIYHSAKISTVAERNISCNVQVIFANITWQWLN